MKMESRTAHSDRHSSLRMNLVPTDLRDVDPGDYVLVEVQPEDYLNVMDLDITEDVDDVTNVDTEDDWIPVTVDPDELDADNLFFEETACQIVVTTTADNGAGSLRAALACVQPGDTITFAPGLAGDTIVITNTLTINNDAIVWNTHGTAVFVELDIPGAVAITAGTNVEIKYLAFISGHTDSPAAIDNAGSLILDDVEIHRNPLLPVGTILVQNTGDVVFKGLSKIIED